MRRILKIIKQKMKLLLLAVLRACVPHLGRTPGPRDTSSSHKRLNKALVAARRENKRHEENYKKISGFLFELANNNKNCAPSGKSLANVYTNIPLISLMWAQNLIENPETRLSGLEAMIKIQNQRGFHKFVVDLVNKYPSEPVIEHAFSEVVDSFSKENQSKVSEFVRTFLDSFDLENFNLADKKKFESAMMAASLISDTELMGVILETAPEPCRDDKSNSSYALNYYKAENWYAQRVNNVRKMLSKRQPAIGLLGYHSPAKPSTNIGDYIQTIAMMGLISRSLPDLVVCHGGGQETLDKIRSMMPRKAVLPDVESVELVWVDRDDPSTTAEDAPIWLPVNGWFMHPKYQNNFGFPFAKNIRPFFLGMHVNNTAMLNQETLAYLKKYEPIGARDYHTADLLTACGIDSFFSGCPTLSLDDSWGRRKKNERSGFIRGAHSPKKDLSPEVTELIHMHPEMPAWTRDKGLDVAWSYLESYSKAESVTTPLLHCYLPCRALGTQVKFDNRNHATDVRFEGLINITEKDRKELTNRLKDNVDAMLTMVLAGEDESTIYRAWRERNAAGVEEIKNRRSKEVLSCSDSKAITKMLSENAPISFLAGKKLDQLPSNAHLGPDVAFCYDEKLKTKANVTIRSLISNTASDVRITLLTRHLSQDDIIEVSLAFPRNQIIWFDVSKINFEKVSLLKHTSASTMDRVVLPNLMTYSNRVIYLDIDVAVLGDINDLHQMDLADNKIAARKTIFSTWSTGYDLCKLIEKHLTQREKTAFRRQFLYNKPLNFSCFNAGVLVMDLDGLRKQGFAAAMMKLIEDYRINDQFAINLFAAGSFAYLPNVWNHFPTQEILDDAKLVHYVGPFKPWHAEGCLSANHWQKYINEEDNFQPDYIVNEVWYK